LCGAEDTCCYGINVHKRNQRLGLPCLQFAE
jgi:hypothetical protein